MPGVVSMNGALDFSGNAVKRTVVSRKMPTATIGSNAKYLILRGDFSLYDRKAQSIANERMACLLNVNASGMKHRGTRQNVAIR